MAITTFGIVDQFIIECEPEAIYQWVSKRTVYSYEEIQDMADSEVKVILFRLIKHIERPVSFARLKEVEIVNGPIQSLVSLSQEKTKLLLEETEINDCFISD